MYYNELRMIIESVVERTIDRYIVMAYLKNTFDWEKVYDSEDLLVTDSFFALTHYAGGEEDISEKEWLYCLEGRREYNIEEKISITIK